MKIEAGGFVEGNDMMIIVSMVADAPDSSIKRSRRFDRGPRYDDKKSAQWQARPIYYHKAEQEVWYRVTV